MIRLISVLSASMLLPGSTIHEKLKPCSASSPDLCGSYEVFENRETRQGRKIALNIAVLPARTQPAQPDPLVVLVGGPGQAATDGAAGERRRFATVQEKRDIVLIDQRGTGRSNPLMCSFDSLAQATSIFLGRESTPSPFVACREDLEQRADLRLYTTWIAMNDLAETLAWLGYREVNLYGGSYGSRAALAFLRQHPNMVRTATLRAVMPPDISMTLEGAGASQRSLDLLFEGCAKQPDCAETFPNLRNDFNALLGQLEKAPVTLEIRNPKTRAVERIMLTNDVFAGALRQALGDGAVHPRIPLAIRGALAGNFAPIASTIAQTGSLLDSLALGMNLSITCAEDASRLSPAAGRVHSSNTFQRDATAETLRLACANWPKGNVPASYNEPVRSGKPVLLLSGQLDSKTPPGWAEAAARHLPNSLHLVMEGVSHSPFPTCAVGIMTSFIAQGGIKDLDTSCLSTVKRPPFAVK